MLSSDGQLLPPAVFREWLEQQDRIGGLVQLAQGVLGSHPRSPCPDADRLATAIASACYGAFVFDVTDWRRRLRVEDEAMRKRAKKLRPALNETSALLLEHEFRLWIVTKAVEKRLRAYYGSEFSFPEPSEFFVLDVLEQLALELEPSSTAAGLGRIQFTTSHGCLDYGRPIQGDKVRNRRQMLAFNLVFLLLMSQEVV